MAPPRKITQTLSQDPTYTALDYGALPANLTALYEAKGHNLILVYSSPQQVSAMAAVHAFAVSIDDIPEEMRAQMRKDLRSFGLVVDQSDGTIHKGDCLLVSQPETARQHFEKENYETWQRQGYASETQAEMLQEEAQRASGGGASPFVGARTEGSFAGHFGRKPPSPPR